MNSAAAANEWSLGPRRYRTRRPAWSSAEHDANPASSHATVNPAARIQSVQPARERSVESIVTGLVAVAMQPIGKAVDVVGGRTGAEPLPRDR